MRIVTSVIEDLNLNIIDRQKIKRGKDAREKLQN